MSCRAGAVCVVVVLSRDCVVLLLFFHFKQERVQVARRSRMEIPRQARYPHMWSYVLNVSACVRRVIVTLFVHFSSVFNISFRLIPFFFWWLKRRARGSKILWRPHTSCPYNGSLVRAARFIIWDEAPNAPRAAFEAVERTCRYLSGDDTRLFGGKIVLLRGDFRQIPPVVCHASVQEVAHLTLQAWRPYIENAERLALTDNMRAREDPVLAIGNAEIPGETITWTQRASPCRERCRW